ncbi:CHASE2 domain-containing protein [Prosthecomicrobium sp. N25]|uniref:CHASE2 domain-containing protein n=1 Tax=Prosthecomicrobium sp. N25 TaxID=3129254 RepID=UPI003076F2CF
MRAIYSLAVSAAGLVALGLVWGQVSVIERARTDLFDVYQVLRPRTPDPEMPVRIVDIDDVSIATLGQWPWPRSEMARMVRKVLDAGAAVIAFDIAFAEPDRTAGDALLKRVPEGPGREALRQALADDPGPDAAFADAIAAAPVVMGVVLTQTATGPAEIPERAGFAFAGDDPRPFIPAFEGALLPIPALTAAAAGFGAVNWLPDQDQIVRRVPLFVRRGTQLVPSLAAESLRIAQGASTFVIKGSNASGETGFGARTGVTAVRIGAIDAETGANGDLRVRYRKSDPRLFIPFWRVVSDDYDARELEGRVVLVGTSAAGLLDMRATPLDAAVPGVDVHAQIIENLLAGIRLVRPDWAPGAERAAGVVLAIALALLLARAGPVGGALIGGAATLGIFAASWLAFDRQGLLLDPIAPWLPASAVYLSGTIALYWSEQRQRKWVREAFGRFVSPAVIERLVSDPDRLVLGGEERTLTVMFSDLRNFTTITEPMDPQELTSFMNRYFTPMTDLVLKSSGTIDKYIGDAIVAFWNAPLDDRDHARHAAEAVLGMFEALKAFNDVLRGEAAAKGRTFVEVRAGIGLATGPCSVGNFGSAQHFDYSAMGDTVNLASRLEGATRAYRVPVLADERTAALAPGYAWIEVDLTQVKGRTAVSRLFTLVGDEEFAASAAFAAARTAHAALLDDYRAGRFLPAAEAAAALARTGLPGLSGLYALYEERCRTFAISPPAVFDGVTRLDSK